MFKKSPESPSLDLKTVLYRLSTNGLLDKETPYQELNRKNEHAAEKILFESLYIDSRELNPSKDKASLTNQASPSSSANLASSASPANLARPTRNRLFVCIKGHSFDSHSEIKEILEQDHTWVVAQADSLEKNFLDTSPLGERIVPVSNSRLALAHLASLFAGDVESKIDLYGVTGTNGKTSVTHILENILSSKWKSKSTSTIQQALTTPDPLRLNEVFLDWHQKNIEKAVIEVSSHGLDQRRVDFISFKGALFTNLSPEHLDYHANMEAYYQAKKRLFTELLVGPAVVCTDTTWGQRLYDELKKECSNKVISFGSDQIFKTSKGFEVSLDDLEGVSRRKTTIPSHLPGRINALNLLGACLLAREIGLSLEEILEAAQGIKPIAGRFEELSLPGADFRVLIDFAHTPAALEKTLLSLREITQNRLLVLFGCGGNRDKGKRAPMGEVAGSLADQIFLTSDNPRLEDPEDILEDIAKGIPKNHLTKTFKEASRRKAIQRALQDAKKGDLLLIAGRGHESHQSLRDPKNSQNLVKVPFQDRDEVLKIWSELKRN